MCPLQTLGSLFILELGLQSNPDALSLFFVKVTSRSKLSESLDYMESLMTALSALK